MASQFAQLDTRIEIVTPENIAFQYRLAGPFRRLPAYLTDLAIRGAVMIALGMALMGTLSVFGATSLAIWFISYFLISWFYGGLFETLWNGQTPGKRMFGLRVLTTSGQPINALQAVLRNILREVDSLPALPLMALGAENGYVPLFTLGLGTMMFTRRFQRLGDLACGTMVVVEHREHLRGVAQVRDPAVVDLASEIPPGFVVSRPLGRTLAAYVERRALIGFGRRVEIARVLGEPLCERFGLPRDTNHDLLLCALYYRAFIADRGGEPQRGPLERPVVAEFVADEVASV
jgi:uncharacterized RDD family membrane protein YckC